MATLETRITTLETDFQKISNDLLSRVRAIDLGTIEVVRDQQVDSFTQELAKLTTQLESAQQSAALIKREIAFRRKPRESTIPGGSTSYTVKHDLGYNPQTQVVNSSNQVVSPGTVTITHISLSTFTVTASIGFSGKVVYR